MDLSEMHPEATKFHDELMEDLGDGYSGLTGEIEATYSFFIETDV